jgi:hypothetical protein
VQRRPHHGWRVVTLPSAERAGEPLGPTNHIMVIIAMSPFHLDLRGLAPLAWGLVFSNIYAYAMEMRQAIRLVANGVTTIHVYEGQLKRGSDGLNLLETN